MKSINNIVNVGNTKTINLKSAILEIANQLNSLHLLDFGALDYRDDQVMKLEPNCEKLITSGWEPIIEFESGIKQTLLWLQRDKVEVLTSKHGEKIILNLPVRPYT
jgi:nucleoside-diphosphate-sugar epimerase